MVAGLLHIPWSPWHLLVIFFAKFVKFDANAEINVEFTIPSIARKSAPSRSSLPSFLSIGSKITIYQVKVSNENIITHTELYAVFWSE